MPRHSYDAEKISSENLRDLFKSPPGVDYPFSRSSLVVGSQGAGKTALLRSAQADTGPGGVYVNLFSALTSITEELGVGGLQVRFDEQVERALRNKSSALILGSVLRSLHRSGLIAVERDYIEPAIPRSAAPTAATTYEEYFYAIGRTPVLSFADHGNTDVLLSVLATLANSLSPLGHEMVLCLDRADSVAWPATYPLFSLIDQSQEYLVLVATRPGLSASVAAKHATSTAGTQYEPCHLGLSPYEDDWVEFIRDAVLDYYPKGTRSRVPSELINAAVGIGRDSLRLILQLLQLRATMENWPERFVARVQLRRQLLLDAASSSLASVGVDFAEYVRIGRDRLMKESEPLPVCLSIPELSDELFMEPRSRNFIELALRESALVMPPGVPWSPGKTPFELEIPPIFVRSHQP